MVHDVYDAEMWAMIDEEDARLASFEEEMYEYRKEQEVITSLKGIHISFEVFYTHYQESRLSSGSSVEAVNNCLEQESVLEI